MENWEHITCISITIWSSTNHLFSAYMKTHLEILRKYLSEDHDTKIQYSLYDLYRSTTHTYIVRQSYSFSKTHRNAECLSRAF